MDLGTGPGISLRPYCESDTDETVAGIIRAGQVGMVDPQQTDTERVSRFRSFQNQDPEAFVLAEVDGEPAGVCVCQRGDGQDAVLHCLMVHPSARRSGVGRRLDAHAAAVAGKWGANRIRTASSIDSGDESTVAFLEACGWRPGSDAGIRMWRSLAELPQAEVPAGYSVRTYRDGDADDFVRVKNAAFRTVDADGRAWTRSDFEAEYLGSPYFHPERIFFAVHDGRPVATTTAWTAIHEDREVGLIHWVAVDPDHARMGLGRLLNVRAMHKMVEMGYGEAILNTGERHVSAVSLYRRLGFRVWRWRVRYEKTVV